MLMAIVVQVAGFMADYARVHYCSTTVVRKLFTCGAFICQVSNYFFGYISNILKTNSNFFHGRLYS